jgi:hypothetical protein
MILFRSRFANFLKNPPPASRFAWPVSSILCGRPGHPHGGQESPMEVAALVLFSSIALWFAEEISGNQL